MSYAVLSTDLEYATMAGRRQEWSLDLFLSSFLPKVLRRGSIAILKAGQGPGRRSGTARLGPTEGVGVVPCLGTYRF